MRTAIAISLCRTERSTLRRWAARRGRLALRARIVLLAADGKLNSQIALELGTDPQTVGRWRRRFARGRLAGIEQDAPRPGRRPIERERLAADILRLSSHSGKGGKRLSTRTLASRLGTNHMLVYRVQREHTEGRKAT